ncbi:unnamed protein product [Trichogramma brassicae]|uniref:Uncharacterized protein n=1 Tax=Trichogramma brassicae TaxID=86971 RepID=A0A6H5J3R2_9HYME|nr:unnamed protein product [Trichogramma brassicae]
MEKEKPASEQQQPRKSHREWRRLVKKLRRQRLRRKAAKLRDQESEQLDLVLQRDPKYIEWKKQQAEQQLKLEVEQRAEHERLEKVWRGWEDHDNGQNRRDWRWSESPERDGRGRMNQRMNHRNFNNRGGGRGFDNRGGSNFDRRDNRGFYASNRRPRQFDNRGGGRYEDDGYRKIQGNRLNLHNLQLNGIQVNAILQRQEVIHALGRFLLLLILKKRWIWTKVRIMSKCHENKLDAVVAAVPTIVQKVVATLLKVQSRNMSGIQQIRIAINFMYNYYVTI